MFQPLHYNIELPEKISDILSKDFWIFDNLNESMLKTVSEPVKFSACTSIYVRRGECLAEINLVRYRITAPCTVTIFSGQILQPTYISPDFDASFIVMSKRMSDNIFLFVNNTSVFPLSHRFPVADIPEGLVDRYDNFYKDLHNLLEDKENPYAFQSLIFTIVSFYYRTAYKTYLPLGEEAPSQQGRIASRFIGLVQMHFRNERFLDFYARELGITPKHLSRTIKAQTGFSAVEWIERFVILEAKVMLRSSNMSIQQIADELNFPSQSFFGKYFKKCEGVSPKEFRNS